MTTLNRDTIVIGAGISGLACAYRLKELGVDVLLLEKSDRVGGVIQSESVDGYLIERGPNSSQGTEELLALVDELGITGDLAEGDPRAPAYVFFGGRLHPVPSGPGAFITSGLLGPAGKLRILAEPLVHVRRDDTEESVFAFAERRIGRQAAERMVAPFVSGIYAGDANQLSVQAAFPRLANLETNYGGLFRGMFAKAREARRLKKSADVMSKAAPTRRRLVSFRTGMAHLPTSLAARLAEDLITGIEECRIARADTAAGAAGGPPRSWSVDFNSGSARHQLMTRHLVFATPAPQAAQLAESVSSELSALLSAIPYARLAIVHLGYEHGSIKRALDGFGFLVAPGEPLRILGCVWNSSLFEGRAPKGHALVTAFIGGARNPEVVGLPDGELVETVHADLQRVLGISSAPHVVAVTRYERAIPQYTIGHAERVRRIEILLNEVEHLWLTGNYLHGVSTGDCIKHADAIARQVAASVISA